MRCAPVAVLWALACCMHLLANPLQQRSDGKPTVYGFDEIDATPDLNWVPCFDKFTCTKLQVPLDYADEAAGTTHVAVIKWSSNNSSASTVTTPQDILINPGGPGGSGVRMVLNELVKVHSTVGTANNIIGFDPRGVNNSGPDLSCVTGGQETYGLYSGFDTTLDVTDKRSYSEIYAKAAAFGEFCTKAHSSANDTAKYANTIATAGDMLRYIESLAKSHGQDPKKSQLWYYGGSYGSVLGTTYASLFPDRVGRLIVDGIADAEDYYRGEWSAGLVDADEAFRYFFQTCFDAGRNGTCPFWAESPAAIERRLDAIIEDITLHPIPFFNEVPAIFTVTDLKMFLAQVPYDPLLLYINLAHTLVQLEQRNPNPLAVALGLGKGSSDCITEKKPAFFEPPRFIACTDANGRYNLSAYDAWVGHANRMAKQSKYMGEWWATITGVQCHKLDIRAPDTQVFNGYPNASHTSNPLLFISTTVDPVTPLRAAEKTVKRFGGAGLLVQNSVGHVSISAHSNCTSAWVQHYLATGQLPPNGTRCEPDSVPFKN